MRLRFSFSHLAIAVILLAFVAGWWILADRKLAALAKNVYWEAVVAGEPELSSRMVAYVTTHRAHLNRKMWGGDDVERVVYKRSRKPNGGIVCQFSWTCMAAARKEPASKRLFEISMRIARDELAGKFTPPAHLKGATHYLNLKASARRNVCWFKTHLIRLGKTDESSHHVFFREPTAKELPLLPKREEVPECKTRRHAKTQGEKK